MSRHMGLAGLLVQALLEARSGAEMGAVVGVLTNLAWATAIGHIGAMRMDHPIATFFVRNIEHSKRVHTHHSL